MSTLLKSVLRAIATRELQAEVACDLETPETPESQRAVANLLKRLDDGTDDDNDETENRD